MLVIRAATYRSLRWTPPFPVTFTLEVLQSNQHVGVINPNQIPEPFRVSILLFSRKRRPQRSGEVCAIRLETTASRNYSTYDVESRRSEYMKI